MNNTRKLLLLFVGVSFLCVFLFSFINFKTENVEDENKTSSTIKDTLVVDKDDKNESIKNDQASQDTKEETSEKTEDKTNQKQEQTNQNNVSNSATGNVDHEGSKEEQKDEIKDNVVVTIDVNVVIKGLNGTLLVSDIVTIEENSSAFAALQNICNKYQMPIQTSGFGKFVYVQAIGDLKEKDHGAKSGWKYNINGQYVANSSGSYVLQNQDVMEWYYEHD